MKYIFNYSFLGRWLEANKDITDRQILHAMGTSSNAGLDSWERMKMPIPTIQLLRFCNTFQVPLSAFIVDTEADYNDGIDRMDYVQPDTSDRFEPDGGYIAQDEKRPLGTRALRDPADVDRIKSAVPGLTTIKACRQEIQTGGIRQSATATHASIHQSANIGTGESLVRREGASPSASEATPAVADASTNLSTLNKMLDIIAEQQKQIGDQQKLIGELTRKLEGLSFGYGIAADDIHHDKR